MTDEPEQPVERRLLALLDHLGIARAHFGVQNSTELNPLIAERPHCLSSLTLAGPNRLLAEAVRPVAERLYVMYGDAGAGAEAVARAMPDLPETRYLRFDDYMVLIWTDVLADHAARVLDLWPAFLDEMQALAPATPLDGPAEDGEVVGITYQCQGSGPALVLLPLLLSPSQWQPLIDRLAESFRVIRLGGRWLGGAGFIEARSTDPGYLRAVRSHVDEIDIRPGASVLDVGCGSGALDRWLARRTDGANPITAVDLNPYLLREAKALAVAEGLAEVIEFRPGNAVDLPFDDGSFDIVMSHTVMEECDADRMLAEMIRVARPGGQVAVMVRATDIGVMWNLPVSAAIRERVEAPVPSVEAGGCADAGLYRRFGQSGLTDLKLFPTMMTVSDPDGVIWAYYEPYVLSQLEPDEMAEWQRAKAEAISERSILYARTLHCAVGRKPT